MYTAIVGLPDWRVFGNVAGTMSIYQRKERQGIWCIDLHIDGRRIRRKAKVQSLEGALEEEYFLKQSLARAEFEGPCLPLHAGSTYAEFAEAWMKEYVAVANRASTQREKSCILKAWLIPAFGALRLDGISTNLIDGHVANWIRKGMSVKRANNILSVLRMSLRCANEWGYVTKVPVIRHHRYFQPVPQYFTRTESRMLLEGMEPGFWKTFVMFLLGTGVRFGEAAALKWEDFELDFRIPIVTIRRGVAHGVVSEPKTNASRRTIALIPEVVLALRAHRHRRESSEWVFKTLRGRFITPAQSLGVLKRACRNAGLPEVSWHKLRHSCATQLLAAGVPLPAIRDVLGHANIEVTAIYAHVVPGQMWEYMQTLSNFSPENVRDVAVVPGPGSVPGVREWSSAC